MAMLRMQASWGVALSLLIGLGQLVAETANYKEVNAYRFVDVRQTSPNSPTIRNFYVYTSIGLKRSESASSLSLIVPTGKRYGFKRSKYISGWWDGTFGITPSQTKHLSLMPGGLYQIQCNGGTLGGQRVSFDLPASLLNPYIPFLEKNSFLLLNKTKLDPAKANTLIARRILKTGQPYDLQPIPEGTSKNLTVQALDYAAPGDAVFVWHQNLQYDDAGSASFTIPAGKLLKNKSYTIGLQTENYYPDGTSTTPEGQILKRLHGLVLYELAFKTSK
jgi:hypothetical protein